MEEGGGGEQERTGESEVATTSGRKRKPSTLFSDYLGGSKAEFRSELQRLERESKERRKSKAFRVGKKKAQAAQLEAILEEKKMIAKLRKSELQHRRHSVAKSLAVAKTHVRNYFNHPPEVTRLVGGSPSAFDLRQALQWEIEQAHVNKWLAAQKKKCKTRPLLPEGQTELADLDVAVAQGCKECTTLLLDWEASSAKMIGNLCKIWWDGDQRWFYARILNYDSHYDKYYVSDMNVQ